MNNNQTTAEETTAEETVATPTTETTTTTSDETITGTTSTSEEGDGNVIATDATENTYSGVTASGPFILGETFNALESTLTVAQGDTFTATDITSVVTLTNNRIVNNDATSAFLRMKNSNVVMTLSGQVVEGDIILDNLSTLSLVLGGQSYYMGIINGAELAKSVSLTIDATSQLILAGNSYVDELTNADATNMNIYSNGYKLFVGGKEVAVNGSVAPEVPVVATDEQKTDATAEEETKTDTSTATNGAQKSTDYTPYIVGGVAILVIIAGIIAVLVHNKKKKGPASPDGNVILDPEITSGNRPNFSAFDDGPVQQPAQPAQPTQPSAPSAPLSGPAQPTPTPPPTRPRPPMVGQM